MPPADHLHLLSEQLDAALRHCEQERQDGSSVDLARNLVLVKKEECRGQRQLLIGEFLHNAVDLGPIREQEATRPEDMEERTRFLPTPPAPVCTDPHLRVVPPCQHLISCLLEVGTKQSFTIEEKKSLHLPLRALKSQFLLPLRYIERSEVR